ncbi:BAR-domain-containing protein [Exidia glandulosa HHB12029]|uniref:BAR-domain-containing protein n=1 Tax=Exidia glandulosa HHB12029 TaxID=1314781 RepID=A0A165PU37_EXIGL|nr:BAR-domain-containing protein [Exidia glandulosa HHB12029]
MKRTPHLVTTKVGMAKKSNDPEFDEYARKFQAMEGATEKLLKDSKVFCDNVMALLTSGHGFAEHFATIFHPIAGEYDLVGKNPAAGLTIKNVDGYQSAMEELKSTLGPELELIESRVVGPVKEYQQVLKQIRKSITKRDHKLVDYDRFNNSLTKLRDKKEKTLNDEKNLFKLEQDFEVAANDYDFWNTTMKNELPRFMTLSTQFIDPLFHSFFYMQLNIFYLMMEKLQGFTDGKFSTSMSGNEIAAEYEEKRGDVVERVEGLTITHRIISTSRMMQQHRSTSGLTAPSGSGSGGLSRSTSTASSATGTSRALPPSSTGSVGFKKAPPPPPSSHFGGGGGNAAPPPYSPPQNGVGASAAMAAATKRAPPPPPGPKPKPKPEIKYVVALYDFAAQAEGDLSFKTGDRIELLEKTNSAEDWWTGRVNGNKGVFPGNYVQET